jgi:hypothetical protein
VWKAALVNLTQYSIDVTLKENRRRNIKRGFVKDLTVCDGGVKKMENTLYIMKDSVLL